MAFAISSNKEDGVALVSDYLPYCDLNGVLKELNKGQRLEAARQVASGMKYLHECDILHCDLHSGTRDPARLGTTYLTNNAQATCYYNPIRPFA